MVSAGLEDQGMTGLAQGAGVCDGLAFCACSGSCPPDEDMTAVGKRALWPQAGWLAFFGGDGAYSACADCWTG